MKIVILFDERKLDYVSKCRYFYKSSLARTMSVLFSCFVQEFGEMETFAFDQDNITCTIKYKLRQDAEQASVFYSIACKSRNHIC